MDGTLDEVKTHDTHRILNIIGEDIFQCDSISIMKTKLSAYKKCISEIEDRVDNEVETSVSGYWRGMK